MRIGRRWQDKRERQGSGLSSNRPNDRPTQDVKTARNLVVDLVSIFSLRTSRTTRTTACHFAEEVEAAAVAAGVHLGVVVAVEAFEAAAADLVVHQLVRPM